MSSGSTSVAATAPRKRSLMPLVFIIPMLVVIVVNGIFIFLALSTWQGLVVEKPYEKGLAYNRALAREEAATQLGWNLELGFIARGEAPGMGEVVARLRDPEGRALAGLQLDAVIERPVEPLPAIPVVLAYRGDGRYAGMVELPQPGQWDVTLTARADGHEYVTRRRIFVK